MKTKMYIGLLVWLGLSLPGMIRGQCPLEVPDTLSLEDFETGLPDGWLAPMSSDGGNWQIDAGTIGLYENPGQGKWIYVNDEAANQIGEASLLSPVYDCREHLGKLEMSFLLNFQQFHDSGWMQIEIEVEGEWLLLWEEKADFVGKITIDLQPFVGKLVQFRWRYEDEGSWGWGMGIDNFLLLGSPLYCSNGRCDFGEDPLNCLSDCPEPPEQAPYWIAPNTNLHGEAVEYQVFLGGTICDDCSEEIALDFAFPFWDLSYSNLWLNSNGNLTFDSAFLVFSPQPFCLDGPRMIAPFFADSDLREGGKIRYYLDPERHYLIINWLRMGHYGCEASCQLRNSFQLILTDGSLDSLAGQPIPSDANVIINYGEMQWTTGSSSQGAEGFGGFSATVGLNAGDGLRCQDYGTFDRPGYAYYGNQQDDHCPPNGVSHLSHRSLFFDGKNGQLSEKNDILSIEGIYREAGHLIRWKGFPNASIDWFVIERSTDSLTFEEIRTLAPAEALPPDFEGYQFLDTEPLPGRSFYRVLSLSPTGSLTTSEVVSIDLPDQAVLSPSLTLRAGPNPFQDHLMVGLEPNPEGLVHYQLSDMAGRKLLGGSYFSQIDGSLVRIDIPELSKGLYIISLQFGEEKVGKRVLHQ